MELIKFNKKIVLFVAVILSLFIGINLCFGATSNAAQNDGSDNGNAVNGRMEFAGQSIGDGGREWSEERGNFRNVVLGMDNNCDYSPEEDEMNFKGIGGEEVKAYNGYIDWLQNDDRPESYDYYYMSRLSFKNLHFIFGRNVFDEGGSDHNNSLGIAYEKTSARLSGKNSFRFYFKMVCEKADGSGEENVYGGSSFNDTYDLYDDGECLYNVLHREEEGEPKDLNTPIEKIRNITGQDDLLEAIHNGSLTFVLYKIQAHH